MERKAPTRLALAALQVALLAGAAWAQTDAAFKFTVPTEKGPITIGLKGPAIGYEDKAPEGKILETQYAILHALMGWGANYNYAHYRAGDEALLGRAGIQVTALEKLSASVLNDSLAKIRAQRNHGIPSSQNSRRPISLQQMADGHRELIRIHAGQLKTGAPVKVAGAGQGAGQAPSQAELTKQLGAALAKLSAATTKEALRAAINEFNTIAVRFGKGYCVGCDNSNKPSDALAQAVKIYEAERAIALGSGKAAAGADLADAATLTALARNGSFFDGSACHDDAPPAFGAGGSGGLGAGGQGSMNLVQNPPEGQKGSAVPNPDGKGGGKKGGRGGGFFGMLGSLFGGLFRTVFSGLVAVGKAFLG